MSTICGLDHALVWRTCYGILNSLRYERHIDRSVDRANFYNQFDYHDLEIDAVKSLMNHARYAKKS